MKRSGPPTCARTVGILAALALCFAPAAALDLGTVGPTYGIAEQHLLEMIQQRLRDKDRSGELQRLMDEARNRSVASIRQPQAVPGLGPTRAARTWYVDPTFTLDRSILDAQGRLMFPAGTKKNPLEIVSMSKRLLFFDGRDARQVAQARHLTLDPNARIKPILTGGSYLDLMKAWKVPVYFDQQGALVRRFGIRQVPAIVSQEGLRLRVDEVALP